MSRITDAMRSELMELINEDGLLLADAVLERARSANSSLHDYFDWDDQVAGENWRLEQANRLIVRVRVSEVTEEDRQRKLRAFYSLPSDRKNGGGRRMTAAILGEPQSRDEMLSVANGELEAFSAKYQALGFHELSSIFAAIDSYLAGNG